MRVRVTLHGAFPGPREREEDVPRGTTADGLVEHLGIHPDMVLVFRGDTPLPGDEELADEDHVRVIRVVSGGAT